MRDKLLGALIGLARATEGNEELLTDVTHQVVKEGLIAVIPTSQADEAEYHSL